MRIWGRLPSMQPETLLMGNFNPVERLHLHCTSELAPLIAGLSLEVVGEAALSTMAAVEGVSYTLKLRIPAI